MRQGLRKYQWTVLGVFFAVFILTAAYARESVRTSYSPVVIKVLSKRALQR